MRAKCHVTGYPCVVIISRAIDSIDLENVIYFPYSLGRLCSLELSKCIEYFLRQTNEEKNENCQMYSGLGPGILVSVHWKIPGFPWYKWLSRL